MNRVLSFLFPALLDAVVVILTSINFSYFAADAYKSSFSAKPDDRKVRRTLNVFFLWLFVLFSYGGRGLYLLSQKLSKAICGSGNRKLEKHLRLQTSLLLSVNVLLCLGLLFLVNPLLSSIFSVFLFGEFHPGMFSGDLSIGTLIGDFFAGPEKDFTDYLAFAATVPTVAFAQFLHYCTIYGFLHTRIVETRLSKGFHKGMDLVQEKYNETQGMASGEDAETRHLIGDGKSKFKDAIKVLEDVKNPETSNTAGSFFASALYRIGSSLLERLEQISSLFVCFKNVGCTIITIAAVAVVLLLLQRFGMRPIATDRISELFMLKDLWTIIVNTVITVLVVKVFQILSQSVLKLFHCKKVFDYSDRLGNKAEEKIEEQREQDKKNDPVFESVDLSKTKEKMEEQREQNKENDPVFESVDLPKTKKSRFSRKEMMDLIGNPKTDQNTISAMVERGEITWDEIHEFVHDEKNKDWWDSIPKRNWMLSIEWEYNKNESSPK